MTSHQKKYINFVYDFQAEKIRCFSMGRKDVLEQFVNNELSRLINLSLADDKIENLIDKFEELFPKYLTYLHPNQATCQFTLFAMMLNYIEKFSREYTINLSDQNQEFLTNIKQQSWDVSEIFFAHEDGQTLNNAAGAENLRIQELICEVEFSAIDLTIPDAHLEIFKYWISNYQLVLQSYRKRLLDLVNNSQSPAFNLESILTQIDISFGLSHMQTYWCYSESNFAFDKNELKGKYPNWKEHQDFWLEDQFFNHGKSYNSDEYWSLNFANWHDKIILIQHKEAINYIRGIKDFVNDLLKLHNKVGSNNYYFKNKYLKSLELIDVNLKAFDSPELGMCIYLWLRSINYDVGKLNKIFPALVVEILEATNNKREIDISIVDINFNLNISDGLSKLSTALKTNGLCLTVRTKDTYKNYIKSGKNQSYFSCYQSAKSDYKKEECKSFNKNDSFSLILPYIADNLQKRWNLIKTFVPYSFLNDALEEEASRLISSPVAYLSES